MTKNDVSFQLEYLSGCQNYSILDNSKRKASYSTPSGEWLCDKTGFFRVSPDWKRQGWYKFNENIGSRIPEEAVGNSRCGTFASGWLQDKHPSTFGETKNAKVCFHGRSDKCEWSTNIKIRHCGSYFIYYLPDTPICELGYCAEQTLE